MHLDLADLVSQHNFSNLKIHMAAADILKIAKSQYFYNRLTNFDEIWHGDASHLSDPVSQ